MKGPRLRLFFADFHGFYLGGHAVILAVTADGAFDLLMPKLKELGLGILKRSEIELTEIDMTKPGVHEVYNGDY